MNIVRITRRVFFKHLNGTRVVQIDRDFCFILFLHSNAILLLRCVSFYEMDYVHIKMWGGKDYVLLIMSVLSRSYPEGLSCFHINFGVKANSLSEKIVEEVTCYSYQMYVITNDQWIYFAASSKLFSLDKSNEILIHQIFGESLHPTWKIC